jgi:PAS domain S-box-containing protein
MDQQVRILIVEDESIVAIDLKRTLENLGYEVLDIVRSGEKAVQKAVQLIPDLILMDIMLEGEMTGIEAVKEIRNQKDIPVIYLTAYANESTLSQAKLTEPFGYILKPFDDNNLVSSIEMALYKHKLDQKVKENEKRYRKLVEKSPIAIGIICGRQIVYANPHAVYLFGAESEEELKKKYIFDFVHNEFAAKIKERLQRIIKDGEVVEGRNEKLITLDGRIIDVEFAAIPTLYQDKPAIQIVIRDITEIIKREKIRQASVKILQAANTASSLNELYAILHKVLAEYMSVSNIYFSFYDEAREILTFPYFVDQIKPSLQERKFDRGLTEYIINMGRIQLFSQDDINNLVSSDKVETDCPPVKSWLGVPLLVHENRLGVVVIKEYYTEGLIGEKEKEFLSNLIYPLSSAIEKKQVEEERKEYTEVLKRLNETKDKFLSLISHDLKSPFNSLIGYTEILKNEIDELSSEERDIFIGSVYESTRHIYNLLNDLLEFSKFYLGLIKIKPKEIDIKKMVDENLELLKRTAAQKGIRLQNNIDKNYMVIAEEDMINSVLRNLLTNSIKFTNKGGLIDIYAKPDGSNLFISVADNGIGMDNSTLKTLFDINSKKSRPGTADEEGTGLGLILTKEFIEKNGGEISVKSEPGKGTTFTFTLPFVPENISTR